MERRKWWGVVVAREFFLKIIFFIRFIGRDGFILSQDVTARLRASGVELAANPTSKRDLKLVQEAFNQWHDETGLPYTHLSRIAAMSIGQNYLPPTTEK